MNVAGGFLWAVKAELGEDVFPSHLAFLSFLEAIFREGIRRGEFRRDLDARLLAMSLASILTAVATDWITRSPEQPFSTLLDSTRRLVTAVTTPRGRPARAS